MTEAEKQPLEYRIGWSASSMAQFGGHTDWSPWGGDPDDNAGVIEDALNKSSGSFPPGLDEAIEASGFEWWVETREQGADQ